MRAPFKRGLLAAALITMSMTTPAWADDGPDLRFSATFADQAYFVGETVPIKVNVTNVGNKTATGAKGKYTNISGSSPFIPTSEWREFNPGGIGATVAPGQTKSFTMVARLNSFNGGDATFKLAVSTAGELTPDDNAATLTIAMVSPYTRAVVDGTLFGDEDRDGVLDPGEELADTAVQIRNNYSGSFKEVRTDAHGWFSFTNVAAQRYTLAFKSPGWANVQKQLRVDGSDRTTNLQVRTVRSLEGTLVPKVEFHENRYRPGDTAQVSIWLANTGRFDLRGVRAGCDLNWDDSHLLGSDDPAHWGVLARSGPGATIAAGEVKAFEVTGIVPDAAFDTGSVLLTCGFGDHFEFSDTFPVVEASARVGA
ncbi:carboxypeptidase regulatory-like domain-containing protein [Amycolatopsis sp. cg5]|uniref:carboxypeptidase regulatory-like domain-containing protein n=1 Tax=Amycolatopsis sp. cg5 TaxID=3238802 RepID=UPI003525B133